MFNCRIAYSINVFNKARDAFAWLDITWNGREFSEDGARDLARFSMRRKLEELGLEVLDFDFLHGSYTNTYRGNECKALPEGAFGWDESFNKKRLTVPSDFDDARNLYLKREAA